MEKSFYVVEWLHHWHSADLTCHHTDRVGRAWWQEDVNLSGRPCDYPGTWDKWPSEEQSLICPILCKAATGSFYIPFSSASLVHWGRELSVSCSQKGTLNLVCISNKAVLLHVDSLSLQAQFIGHTTNKPAAATTLLLKDYLTSCC